VEALKKILRLYPQAVEELGAAAVKQRLSKPYADMAHTWLRLQEHKHARRLFRQAIAYWPGNWRNWPFYLITFLTPAQLVGLRKLYGRMAGSGSAEGANSRLRAAL
jgi:hypothetical protein